MQSGEKLFDFTVSDCWSVTVVLEAFAYPLLLKL